MKTTMFTILTMLYLSIALSETPDTTKTYNIESVTVEGIRADSKTPIAQKTVSVIELNKINFGQEPNLILMKLPSITAYSDAGSYSNYSYIRLRGIDQTRINITLDGVPLSEPEDQGAYFADFTNFLASVSDVQIQRGIGTTTNGVAAYAGSMNFNSIILSNEGGDVQYGMGSFNSSRFTAGYSTGLLDRFAFYARYSNSKSDGYKYHSGNDSYSWFFGGGYFGKTDAIKIFGFSGDTKSKLAYNAVTMPEILNDPRTNDVSELENDHFNENLIEAQYLKQYDNASLSSTLYYSHLYGNYTCDNIWYGAPTGTPVSNYKLRSDLYGGIINYNVNFESTFLHFGLHLNTYRRDHYMNFVGDATDQYFNNGYKDEQSIFAKVIHSIGNFSLFADLQLRNAYFLYMPQVASGITNKSIDWRFFNPRVGTTYSVNSNRDVYISIGYTGKEPTRLDMFAGGDYIDSTNVNELGDLTRVKPEYVIDLEFGTNYKYDNLTYKLNGYMMKFHNEIEAIGPMGVLGLPLRKNVESSYRMGIEFDGDYKIGRFTLSNNTSLNHSQIAKYITDYNGSVHNFVTPLMTPWFISNTSIEYTGHIVSLVVGGRYVSSVYLDNENNQMLPDYFVIDLTGKLNISNNISIALQYNNLGGKRYLSGGYVSDGVPYYFVQAPENYYATVKVIF